MSTTFIQPGDIMEFTAPTGGVTRGVPVFIGGLPVIPTDSVAQTLRFEGKVNGVFTVPKTITEGALVEGQPMFWNSATSMVTVDHSLGLPLGLVAAAALTSDTTCVLRLTGESLSGRTFTVRKRFAVAAVNAGATLLAAIPGVKYRMIDAAAIAIGGAVTTVTTVDILATLASSSRKLVANAQAGLTQSTLIRAGSATGALLADGASFTANDAGAPITVNITGAAITVATSVDFIFTYAIE